MKIPKRLQPLVDDGLIDDVIRRLKSGKEIRCAKVYKEAEKRNFKQAVHYQEGRKVRNSRNARAMSKGSKFGRQQQDKTWQQTAMEALCLLAKDRVRLPQPDICLDSVLVIELITDEERRVAPRLSDVTLTPEQARNDHALMMNYSGRMLCAVNVLMDNNGPLIIDLPQVVDAAANNYAKTTFERDINNMSRHYGQYAPELLSSKYAQEIWALYQEGNLTQESILSGKFIESNTRANIGSVLAEIHVASEEHRRQLMARKQKD
ncbi:MAG: serine protein kinase RIO [Serratia symbiotica]|nr:serine protein kinase RIO [Serratia symbiotica]